MYKYVDLRLYIKTRTDSNGFIQDAFSVCICNAIMKLALALIVCVVVGLVQGLARSSGDDQPVLSPCISDPGQDDLLQFVTYTLTPPRPKTGKTLTVSVSGILSEVVANATFILDLTMNQIFPMRMNETFSPLNFPQLNSLLPLQPGNVTLTNTGIVPFLRVRTISGKIDLVSDTGKLITCVNIHVDF